jgi:hypothetical protein
MAMALTILGSGEEIALLTSLPWELPLEEWEEDPELGAQRGISRHVVRLVNVGTPEKAEVFALGSLIFFIFFGCAPFNEGASSKVPLYKLVIEGKKEEFFRIH